MLSLSSGLLLDTSLSRAPLVSIQPGVPISQYGGSLTRATAATQFDGNGILQTVAAGVERYQHYVTANDSQSYQTRLYEGAATNVVLWNRDLTNAAWTKTSITAALDQTGIDGVANSASSLTATGAGGTVLQAITLASSARRQSAYVKRITGSGAVSMTTDGGTTWTAITLTGSWTRVTIPSQTVANPSVGFKLATSGDKIAVDYVQNETGSVQTSPIATTAAAVTRNADQVTMPFAAPPQAMTVYAKFVELGTSLVTTAQLGLFVVGGTLANACLAALGLGVGGEFELLHREGADVFVNQTNVLAYNDLVELRALLTASGSVQLGQTKNGAAETLTGASAANALASAWVGPTLRIGARSAGSEGFAAISSLVIARGNLSLAEMRSLV